MRYINLHFTYLLAYLPLLAVRTASRRCLSRGRRSQISHQLCPAMHAQLAAISHPSVDPQRRCRRCIKRRFEIMRHLASRAPRGSLPACAAHSRRLSCRCCCCCCCCWCFLPSSLFFCPHSFLSSFVRFFDCSSIPPFLHFFLPSFIHLFIHSCCCCLV